MIRIKNLHWTAPGAPVPPPDENVEEVSCAVIQHVLWNVGRAVELAKQGPKHARDGKTKKNAPRNEKIVSEFRKLMARKVPPSRTEAARRIGEKQTPPLGEDQVRRILGKVWDSAKPQK